MKRFSIPEAIQRVAEIDRKEHPVGFTNGCFDLFHAGHREFLERASMVSHHLVVAVNSDESVRRLKGPSRPVLPIEKRLLFLENQLAVDTLVVFDTEEQLVDLIRQMRPDYLFKGSEYFGCSVPGTEFAGRLFLLEMLPGVSTTSLLSQGAKA